MGKWDHITAKLPRLQDRGSDQKHQDRVDETKALIQNPPPSDRKALTEGERADILAGVEMRLRILNQDLLRGLRGQAATDYVRCWRDARDLKDALDDLISNTSLVMKAYEQLMLDAMDAEDVRNVKLGDGRGVSTYFEPYAKVIDKDAVREWAEADPDLRRLLALHPGTLASLVKKMLEAGQPAPPGTELFSVAVVRKQGDKEVASIADSLFGA